MARSSKALPLAAYLYLAAIITLGGFSLGYGFSQPGSDSPTRFLCYLVFALVASGLKVSLPSITGTMSVNFLFILIGVVQMSLPETLAVGLLGTLAQSLWKPKTRPKLIQVLFNTASMATAVVASYMVYSSNTLLYLVAGSTPGILALAASTFFVLNTMPIAGIVALTEKKPLTKTWHNCYFWSFPYYLAGASIAWLLNIMSQQVGWANSLLLLPIIYFIYRSYRVYLDRLDGEKQHVEEMAGLHLRTIEALALAIEAKDNTTHDHLRRVRIYALEIGKELGLLEDDLEALRAAALLHDIGKLAVPEHIISKPGKLTPEEFEKMKIHPIVGAEILERVQFPYPVVPIVRAHHENWDGSGYPSGLRGEEIPIGARILAAVDTFDALASNRQYRRALPLDEAMRHVLEKSGKTFDPRVVEVLNRRYKELEQLAHVANPERSRLSTDVKIEKGAAPAAGFERGDSKRNPLEFLGTIAAARQEVQLLFEMTQDLGSSLSLDETLSVMSIRLSKMIPYHGIAVYVKRGATLVPEYVNGEDFRLFSSLEIPVGEGLSGWVAENQKPILNGNPSVESAHLKDDRKFSKMRSALAVPLEGLNGPVGVLTLYRSEKDAFTSDHLRMLLAISSKVSLSVENALKYRQVESSATTDYLTELPNARSLFLRLDSELARSKRKEIPLAVLVCDLDGFKLVNDRYGHLEGNKVLRIVADGLKQNCREYDYVARMGGDEFVLLLPGMTPEALPERLAALREIAAQAGRLTQAGDCLSMSCGEAFYPQDGVDAEQLLAEADRRMYKVKEIGKSGSRKPPVLDAVKGESLPVEALFQ
jgi:diguanylate cyclase (GGDEF)-like protein/putative nucleotidyltransferase with HDIG domain